MREKGLQWAMELQSLAQAGLTYGKDPYDLERYRRIREISAEMVAEGSGLPLERVQDCSAAKPAIPPQSWTPGPPCSGKERFCWCRKTTGCGLCPGGWCDVLQSVGENAVKETREEAGLEVAAESIIAVQDRARHNRPDYAYGVCKVFVLCRALGGSFRENIETVRSDYFPEDALPPLSEAKNTPEQVRMCFAAYRAGDAWKTQFD